MRDPWMASDGFSYERQAIKQWFGSRGARSPTTGLALPDMVCAHVCCGGAGVCVFIVTNF